MSNLFIGDDPHTNIMNFDGVDEVINIDGALTPLSSTTKGTWSAWINASDLNAHTVINFGDTNANSVLFLFTVDGGGVDQKGFTARARIGGTIQWEFRTIGPVLSLNTWHNIAVVQDGIQPTFYIDGVVVAGQGTGGFFISTDKTAWFNDYAGVLDNGRIGSLNRNNSGNILLFEKQIDEVSFWNTDFSSAEITELYNNGFPTNLLNHSKSANLVAWYRMGEEAIFDGINWTIPDASTNSNDGTSVNMEAEDRILSIGTAELTVGDDPHTNIMNFDGVDEFIDIDPVLNAVQLNTKGTLSAWINIDNLPVADPGYIIDFQGALPSPGEPQIVVQLRFGGEIQANLSRSGIEDVWSLRTTNQVIFLGQWHHVAIVQDGISPIIYIDGVAVAQGFIGSPVDKTQWFDDHTFTDAAIGANSLTGAGQFFERLIDEVSVWDKDLSSTEITELYNNGIPTNLINHSATANLVAWYRMGESATFDGSNWTVPDNSTNSNNGTSVNMELEDRILSTGTASIRFGPFSHQSLSFDGVDEILNIDNISSAVDSNIKGTLSAWVNLSNISGIKAFIGLSSDTVNDGIVIFNTSGKVRVFLEDSGLKWDLITDSVELVVDTWHHVAVVQDGISPVLYIDGVAVAQTFTATTDKTLWFNNLQTIENGRIGSYVDVAGGADSFFMAGKIDEVSFWDTNFSQTDITNLYNNGIPNNLLAHAKSANLVAWYRIGEGAVFAAGNWTIPDASINSNDGTSVNMEEGDRVEDAPS